jgi:hypothetical protein
MSASAAPMTKPVAPASGRRASAIGLVRGELRKMAHMRIAWTLLGLFTLFGVGSQLILVGASNTKDQLIHNTPGSFSNLVSGDLSILQVFSGIVVLVLAAHVIGTGVSARHDPHPAGTWRGTPATAWRQDGRIVARVAWAARLGASRLAGWR